MTNIPGLQGSKYLILAAAATLYARIRVRNGDGSKFGPMTYSVRPRCVSTRLGQTYGRILDLTSATVTAPADVLL